MKCEVLKKADRNNCLPKQSPAQDSWFAPALPALTTLPVSMSQPESSKKIDHKQPFRKLIALRISQYFAITYGLSLADSLGVPGPENTDDN